jgi:hypothetical protein
MSNALAIATVTKTLQRFVQAVIAHDDATGVQVTTRRPERATDSTDTARVNIFLYQVTPSIAWRNADLPARSGNGTLIQRPQVGLDLYYLLSFSGSEEQLVPQRLLGSVISALHAQPLLPPAAIRDTVADASNSYLATSNLAEQVERVTFVMQPLNLEELSKLWSVFFQTPYVLSVAYQASVVLIEADLTPQPARPVDQRLITVQATADRAPEPPPVRPTDTGRST